MLRGCDLQFGLPPKSDNLVLRGHVLSTAFLWLVTIGGPTFSAVAALCNTHPLPDWRGPWFISAACVILGVFGLLVRERVVFTPDYIRKTGPFMRTQCLAWTEIVSVTFARAGLIRLFSATGSSIRVPPDLVGVVDMVDVLERFLPLSVLDDCKDNLRIYRKFVGTRRHST